MKRPNSAPKVKKWVCSPHALKRIEERKITVEELTQIIEVPEIQIQQGPKWIFAKTILKRKDNLLAAVLLERKDHDLWLVITVMVNFQKK